MKRRDIVRDDLGNHYAIDAVGDQTVSLHSVATKEAWDEVPIDGLTLVEGLVEA